MILTSRGVKGPRHNWRALDSLDLYATCTFPRADLTALECALDSRRWTGTRRYTYEIDGDVIRVRRVR